MGEGDLGPICTSGNGGGLGSRGELPGDNGTCDMLKAKEPTPTFLKFELRVGRIKILLIELTASKVTSSVRYTLAARLSGCRGSPRHSVLSE